MLPIEPSRSPSARLTDDIALVQQLILFVTCHHSNVGSDLRKPARAQATYVHTRARTTPDSNNFTEHIGTTEDCITPHHTRSQLTILLDIHARCRVNVRIQQVDLHFVAGQQTVMQDLDPWQGVGKVEILFALSGSSFSQASHVLYTLAAR